MNEIKTPASDVLVKSPTPKHVDLSIQIETFKPADIQALETEARNRIKALFVYDKRYENKIKFYNERRFKIGSKVQLSTIIDVLMDLPQVKNVVILQPSSDLELQPSELPVLRSLNLQII